MIGYVVTAKENESAILPISHSLNERRKGIIFDSMSNDDIQLFSDDGFTFSDGVVYEGFLVCTPLLQEELVHAPVYTLGDDIYPRGLLVGYVAPIEKISEINRALLYDETTALYAGDYTYVALADTYQNTELCSVWIFSAR